MSEPNISDVFSTNRVSEWDIADQCGNVENLIRGQRSLTMVPLASTPRFRYATSVSVVYSYLISHPVMSNLR